MTARKKWLLWADATVLTLLVLFFSNLAWVLPARPHREYLAMQWPPLFGENYFRVPDWSRGVSATGVLITGGVLIGFGLRAAWKKVKTALFQ